MERDAKPNADGEGGRQGVRSGPRCGLGSMRGRHARPGCREKRESSAGRAPRRETRDQGLEKRTGPCDATRCTEGSRRRRRDGSTGGADGFEKGAAGARGDEQRPRHSPRGAPMGAAGERQPAGRTREESEPRPAPCRLGRYTVRGRASGADARGEAGPLGTRSRCGRAAGPRGGAGRSGWRRVLETGTQGGLEEEAEGREDVGRGGREWRKGGLGRRERMEERRVREAGEKGGREERRGREG